MRTPTYPSDLTDEQWALVEGLIPVYPGGRPRKASMRDVLDAIFYLLKTGCAWRYLPKDFPPKSTVWKYFDEWRYTGTLDRIHDTLRDQVRLAEGRTAQPSAGSIDTQSVPTSEGGEATGYDTAKKVKGRKRHIVVDGMGLLLAVAVTAADADDGTSAPCVPGQLDAEGFPRRGLLWVDSKYHNHSLYRWLEGNAHYTIEVVRRPRDAEGFVPLPRRWVVERTIAWLKRYRRLSVDREKTTRSSEALIRLAMTHRMLNRLRPKNNEPEFHYRNIV